MERKRNLVGICLIPFLLFGCRDSAFIEPPPANDASLTKAVYDSGYVKWDNVDHLTYKLGSDVVKDDLSIPWEPGSANAVGVPKDWVDDNLGNADSGKRAYSKANTWYAMEVECAYEASSQSANRLMFRLWAANISKSQTIGSFTGTINGNVLGAYLL